MDRNDATPAAPDPTPGEAPGDSMAWLRGQREALEAALNGRPLEASLGALVRTATDALGDGTRAAFYLANSDGTALHHVVGMPAEYAAAVDGFKIGPDSLACGLATATGEPVITADVTTDPRWGPWRGMAARFDFRGCWSFPVHTAAGRFAGTLAVYSRRPREATARDRELAALLTHTAAIIIARHLEAEARKRAEAALGASEGWLRLALAAARMGTWALDPATWVQTRDASLNGLLGLDRVETAQPFGEFLDRVHPDDRRAVRAAFDAAARGLRPIELEFRIVRPDGAVRWLRDQGDVLRVGGGARLAGACADVTDRREAHDALRASNERLRQVVEAATDYAILTLDPLRRITSWSPGAEAAFGYATREVLGSPGDLLFTPEDRAAGAPEREVWDAQRHGRAADERWHVRKDGTRFYASGVLTPYGLAGSLGYVKVLRDLTERKRMEDALRDARDRLEEKVAVRTAELAAALDALEAGMARRRDMARRLTTAEEAERLRVARDLHDQTGQLLTGLSLALAAVAAGGDLPPAAAARLAEARRLAGELGRQVSGLAFRLRPTALDDVGLEAALGHLVADWSARTGVPADFQTAGLDGPRLPAEVETVLYRVVQEALTNAARHARATQVSVVVARRGGTATAVVEDDGVGFDPETAGAGRLGLVGMRERVELVGGELVVETGPGAGTTVIARVPVAGGGERP